MDVAVVTGASRGIGRAVAARLAEKMHVMAVARSEQPLRELAAANHTVEAVAGDIAADGFLESVAAAADAAGTLRVWVNNAATVARIPFADTDIATWDHPLAVNLRAAVVGSRLAVRRMAASGGGTLVHVASLSGVPAVEKFPGLAAYNVSKAALIALSEAIAVEGREHGVRSVSISPGAVDTEMLREAAPHLKPLATPEDVADLVAFLVTEPGGRLLSGSNLPLFTNG